MNVKWLLLSNTWENSTIKFIKWLKQLVLHVNNSLLRINIKEYTYPISKIMNKFSCYFDFNKIIRIYKLQKSISYANDRCSLISGNTIYYIYFNSVGCYAKYFDDLHSMISTFLRFWKRDVFIFPELKFT